MSEFDVNAMLERSERAALLLGLMTGGITTILNNINKGILTDIEDVFNELNEINKVAFAKINDIYYKHLEAEHE